MRNKKHTDDDARDEYRLTVVLSREEGARWAAYLESKGAKKSTYARRLILDDMARAGASA